MDPLLARPIDLNTLLTLVASVVAAIALFFRTLRARRTPMRSLDSVWVAMDDDDNHLVVNSVFLFDERLDRAKVRSVVTERLFQQPRFRSRIERQPGLVTPSYYWVPCDEVDLDHHVMYHQCAAADDAALFDHVSQFCNQEMDMDRPLWQFHIFEDPDTGKSCLLFRVHHAIADGVGLVTTLLGMTDPTDPDGLKIKQVGRKAGAARPTVWHQVVAALALAAGVLRAAIFKFLLLTAASDTKLSTPEVSKHKRMAWTRPLPLDVVKKYSKARGVTVNDAILGLISTSAHDFLVERDDSPSLKTKVRCMIPMNLKPLEKRTELRNDVTMGVVDLHVGKPTTDDRLAGIHGETQLLKAGGEPLMYQLAIDSLTGISPLWAVRQSVLHMTSKFSCVVSNVPGPQCGLHFADTPVRQLLGVPPLLGPKLGLSFGVFSYNGAVTLGLYADSNVVDGDATAFTKLIEREFASWESKTL